MPLRWFLSLKLDSPISDLVVELDSSELDLVVELECDLVGLEHHFGGHLVRVAPVAEIASLLGSARALGCAPLPACSSLIRVVHSWIYFEKLGRIDCAACFYAFVQPPLLIC